MQTIQATETKTRFDIYMAVHKGLRAFMTDVLTTVGRIDGFDAGEVAAGVASVRHLLEICGDHLFKENQFVHPAMEARRYGSARSTANDHVKQEELVEQLETQLRKVERTSGPGREAAVLKLYRTLALFVAENLQHMHVEEHDNNETLWSLYTDEELHRIHDEILQAVEPVKMATFLRWMLPNVDHNERIKILAAMQSKLPKQIFDQLLSSILPLLRESDRTKLDLTRSHFN
jgi:hemerythrin-like domain-containing protein